MFIAVHVDDLILVVSSSQLYEVVSEMKQYFTMENTLLLSVSAAQPYVGARYSRHNDVIWELPTTRYVECMLEEHGMTSVNPVVTPALGRNDDDEHEHEANTDEHQILRRVLGKSQFLAPRRLDVAFATNRLERSWQNLQKQTSSPRNVFCVISVVRWIWFANCRYTTERARL